MKNTLYFPHDYHARHDPKLDRLNLTLGYEGIGIYWCLIEMLYEQGGYLGFDDLILYARQDKTLCERIANVVRGFGLFKFDDTRFWSESCLNRLGKIKDKCEKASQSANKRWGGNANAMPMQCEGNAINKRNKEINKESIGRFTPPSIETIQAYCKERKNGINATTFFDHYQANGWIRGKTKMKDWQAAVRTWEKNEQPKKQGMNKL